MERAPERYGSYVVYESIGQGGMATVHRAEQIDNEGTPVRQVALKRLLPSVQKEMVTLFLDEARLLRYLHHPNIAETFDSGRVFGTYFIAMEYVRGPTLKQLVTHCGATTGSVPQPVTLNVAAQLCDALDHAHNRCDERGKPLHIVHRDITPANIIISDTGLLKLIDFGLAKAKSSSEHTERNVIKGKFGYVAPEYLGGKLDHRADLWAVGIIMYELLTSRRLFDGADAFETMQRIRQMPIPRPSIGNPRVTPELDEVVMRALERDPRRRWQSAAEMGAALRSVIAHPDHPGLEIGNAEVIEWVNWVFTIPPGTDASGMAHLLSMVGPNAPETEATTVGSIPEMGSSVVVLDEGLQPPTSARALKVWYGAAVVWALALIASVIVAVAQWLE